MDVLMPHKDGVEACREIMESAPETKLCFTHFKRRRRGNP